MTTALFLILIASKLTAAVPADGPFRVPPPAWRELARHERMNRFPK